MDKHEMVDVSIRLDNDVIEKCTTIGMTVEVAMTKGMNEVIDLFKKKRYFHGRHRTRKQNPPRKKGWTLVKYPKCFRQYIDMLRYPQNDAVQARQTGKSIAAFWFRMSTMHAVMNSRMKNYPIFKDIQALHEPDMRPVDRAVLCDKMISIYQFAE